jgi:hypothetical protein
VSDAYKIVIGKSEDNWRDIGVNGKMILKRNLKIQDVRMWTGLICLRIGSSGGLL